MKGSEVFPIVFSILCCINVHAQSFGGHPGQSRWEHMGSDSIDLIYQPAVREKAVAIFSLINSIPPSLTSPHTVRRLPLVLQQRTIFSNGYVGMGPYRSEFQLTPLQNSFRLGSVPWYVQLALHEYRHVQQFDFFNRGVTRVVYKILGQEAGALLNSMAIPNWFWEGDAVWQETRLSTQGRGRLPYFFNEARAVLQSPHHYSYMKWRNGSLRDLVPDHYPFGYLLIGYGTERFGADLWSKTISDASRFKPLFYPFQQSFKRHAGISFKHFTEDALKFYRDSLAAGTDSLSAWAYRQKHYLSSAEYPAWINSNEIIYTKTSYRETPAFYKYELNTGKNTRIATRRISADNQFSYNNGRIVYTSYQADKRWSWNDYSRIVIHDLNSNNDRELTGRHKYFSPDINEAGTKVVAVHIDSSAKSQLHVLEVANGSLSAASSNPANFFFTYPKFYQSQLIISAVRDSTGRMGIIQWNFVSGEQKFLLPLSYQVIGFLSVQADTIVFSATSNRKESAFRIVPGGSLSELSTGSKTSRSVYQPSLHGGRVVVSAMSVVGNQLLIFPDSSFHAVSEKNFNQSRPDGLVTFGELQEAATPIERQNATENPAAQVYKKAAHLFNFHSLRPYILDPDYSLSLVSENVLNDFRTELTYLYNRNEGYHQVGFYSTYAGLFPWIRGGIDYTFHRSVLMNSSYAQWDEIQPRIGLSVPMDLSGRYHFKLLRTSVDYVYSRQILKGYYSDSVAGGFGYLNPAISWLSRTQQARQDIYPRFAQSMYMDYRAAINGRAIQQLLVTGSFYFPGAVLNHSTVLQAAYQSRSKGNYQYGNSFPFSRGYTAVNFQQMQKLGINYHFPLAYPDAGIAQVVYLLRVRANPFFDFTNARYDDGSTAVFKSAGAEIYFDTKWWNQEAVSFGIRYSRLLDPDPFGRTANQWEIIVPVNLFRR